MDAFPLLELKKNEPKICMVLQRRCNKNQVILEAQVDEKKNITGISQYWLDVDPTYQAKARKKGIMTDRAEFCSMDTFAYGITTKQIRPNIMEFFFNKLGKGTKFTVMVRDDGQVIVILPGQREVLKVFIEDYRILGIPKVKHIQVTVRHMTTGEISDFNISQ